MSDLHPQDQALLDLLTRLTAQGYAHVTITPDSHARVLARRPSPARSLPDVFGWSLPFAPGLLPADLLAPLEAGGMLVGAGALQRSAVRVSTVHGLNFLHSAYPTEDEDAVFLGPDSYRFADLIARELANEQMRAGGRIVDIGVGAGVGAIVAARLCPAATVVATDPNPAALRLARINAAAAGVDLQTVQTEGLDGVDGAFDLALLNPPYIIDARGRTYRDGGAMHGGQLSLDLTVAALAKLAPGGRLILYTGSAVVDGRDALGEALAAAAREAGCALAYRELDPDVFGEELSEPAYAEVDRIALVAAVFEPQPARRP